MSKLLRPQPAALSILLIPFLVVSVIASAEPIPPPLVGLGPRLMANEVLVATTPHAGIHLAELAAHLGGQVIGEIPQLGVSLLRLPEGEVKGAVSTLSRDPTILYAEPNGIAYADVDPNDPYDNTTCYHSALYGCVNQWAWAKISAYKAWDVTTGSPEVIVAVVDTGVDTSHEDLVEQFALPTPEAPTPVPEGTGEGSQDGQPASGPRLMAGYDFINGDADPEDDNGHGTHVAGIIGAATDNERGVAGLSWQVSILPVKVLSATGSGSYFAVASGIVWAADQGARVINLSLSGGMPSQTLEAAVRYAWEKGAVLTCSAGNGGGRVPTYPAAYPECLTVAASDVKDQKAYFSNFGPDWVDVAAPGVAILSTMPDSTVYLNNAYGFREKYDALSGTSMAAPHVAGLAALVWSTRYGVDNVSVRDRIECTADPVPGTGVHWRWGRINAYRAVLSPGS